MQRGSEALTLETKRAIAAAPKMAKHDLPGPSYRLLSPEVGYVKISDLKSVEAVPMVQAFAKTKGMVIDLRNYPGDFPIFALGSLLMDKPTPFVQFSRLDLKNPGAFYFDSPTMMPPKEPHYAGKIVVLVDEVTQSSAEYHAMAFRAAPNAMVMGSMTAGADGNVSALLLPGGLRTMFSGIGVFYPDNRPTQRVGIVPDKIVHPTIAGVREGRDEVLEAALRHILGAAADEASVRNMSKHQKEQ
jgi:C-terminal processing protease CtpA/Prc